MIHQPSFIPWLGFYDMLDAADEYIIYDTVQFDKNGWRNRNKIKLVDGVLWLTIPVQTSGNSKQINKDIKVQEVNAWKKKHLNSIYHSYKRAPFFDEIYKIIEPIWKLNSNFLLDYQLSGLQATVNYLEIKTKVRLASELQFVSSSSDKQARIIDLCKYVGANTYLNGAAGSELYQKEIFKNENIGLYFQNYKHPQYSQLHGKFIGHLSILDLLFCEGKESLNFIRAGRNFV
jgi:hypothetical protein